MKSKNIIMRAVKLLLPPSFVVLAACAPTDVEETLVEGRWYSQSQVAQGKEVFAENCAVCHGNKAQGLVRDWKKVQADGKYPAPPLNGKAHAWHHPQSQLLRTINQGGVALGGTMPSFKDKLSEAQKLSALAYFQSFWSKEIYQQWNSRN